MENLSDIYHRAFEVWVYDQLEPEEKLFVGRKPPRVVPGWATRFPDHLIKNAPQGMTDQENEERQDEYLRKHGL